MGAKHGDNTILFNSLLGTHFHNNQYDWHHRFTIDKQQATGNRQQSATIGNNRQQQTTTQNLRGSKISVTGGSTVRGRTQDDKTQYTGKANFGQEGLYHGKLFADTNIGIRATDNGTQTGSGNTTRQLKDPIQEHFREWLFTTQHDGQTNGRIVTVRFRVLSQSHTHKTTHTTKDQEYKKVE